VCAGVPNARSQALRGQGGELAREGLGHLGTSEVGEVLERLVRRMERHLRRSGLLRTIEDEGEAAEVPQRSPGRGPPYWKSRVLRLQVLGEEDDCGGRGGGADEVA